MQHFETKAAQNESLKQREALMTDEEWREWHKLTDSAEKLIKGITQIKTETAKRKRELNIVDKLNSANDLYPLRYENWMQNYWQNNTE